MALTSWELSLHISVFGTWVCAVVSRK